MTIYGLTIAQWVVFAEDFATVAWHLAINPSNPLG